MPQGILFDYDGTLRDSMRRHGYEALCSVFAACGVPAPTYTEVCRDLVSPFSVFYQNKGILLSEADISRLYRESLETKGVAKFFDDVGPVLIRLRRNAGIKLGIASARDPAVIEDHLRDTPMDGLFCYVAGGNENKVKAITGFWQTFGLDSNEVWYVGDIAHDMENAREAGVVPVGITRGHPTREVLCAAGAHTCVDHLVDLLDLL